jgi:hypothetical protein
VPHLENSRWGKVWQVGQVTAPARIVGGVDNLPHYPYCAAGAKGGVAGFPTSVEPPKDPSEALSALPRSPKYAKLQGSPRYFTGVPCKRGHVAARFTASATCTLCHNKGCPKARKLSRAAYRFRQRFGADIEIKLNLIEKQNGACAICQRSDEKLVLDHCHATGGIREALCHKCNIGLGMAEDDPERLRAMAVYLENWRRAHGEG